MKISEGLSTLTCLLLAGICYQLHGIREAMPATRAELNKALESGNPSAVADVQNRNVLAEVTDSVWIENPPAGSLRVDVGSTVQVEGSVAIEGRVEINDMLPVEVEIKESVPIEVSFDRE